MSPRLSLLEEVPTQDDTLEDVREVIDLADPVGDLAEAWLADNQPPPVAVPVSAYLCEVARCRSIPFVRLKTTHGSRNLCLCHFQSVKSRALHTGGHQ